MRTYSCVFLLIVTIISCNKKEMEINSEFMLFRNIDVRYITISRIDNIRWIDNEPKYYNYLKTVSYKCPAELNKKLITVYFNRPNKCDWKDISPGEPITFRNNDKYLFPFSFKKDEWYQLDYGSTQWRLVFTLQDEGRMKVY